MSHPGLWFPNYWLSTLADSGGDLPPPSLSVADKADGTGATATIGDTGSVATNRLYVKAAALADPSAETGSWTLAGERTGSGTMNVAVSPGIYEAYLKSTIGPQSVVTTVVCVAVSSSDTSVYYQCCLAVQARIRALGLSGIDPENIVVRKVYLNRQLGLPCIVVSQIRETIDPTAGTNLRDDKVYQILVSFYDKDGQTLTDNQNRYNRYRDRVVDAFRSSPRLAGVPTSINGSVEPLDVFPFRYWQSNDWVCGLILKIVSRELRPNQN